MSKPITGLVESLFANTKEYVENRFELFLLKLTEKVSSVVSTIISGVIMFVVFFIFFIVFNIGIALLIGDLIGHAYIGFLIVAGVYAIAGIILVSMRGKLFKSAIAGIIIRKLYKNAAQKSK